MNIDINEVLENVLKELNVYVKENAILKVQNKQLIEKVSELEIKINEQE